MSTAAVGIALTVAEAISSCRPLSLCSACDQALPRRCDALIPPSAPRVSPAVGSRSSEGSRVALTIRDGSIDCRPTTDRGRWHCVCSARTQRHVSSLARTVSPKRRCSPLTRKAALGGTRIPTSTLRTRCLSPVDCRPGNADFGQRPSGEVGDVQHARWPPESRAARALAVAARCAPECRFRAGGGRFPPYPRAAAIASL